MTGQVSPDSFGEVLFSRGLASLFVFTSRFTRFISKNAVLFLFRDIIPLADALIGKVELPPRAHSIRSVSISIPLCEIGRSPGCWSQ